MGACFVPRPAIVSLRETTGDLNCDWGDTMIIIVGLPDAAVKESRDRVTTAQTNSGFNRLPHASGC
ncbi:MAG: magnesium chelatase domain-containing protein [Verrucomicrobiota bacterium]